ncbi:MAG: hypothetical protein HUJ76_09110, partial [Parasporobacterium sp.]|nr:hypothetical protein [Parasporobacterium sp.]
MELIIDNHISTDITLKNLTEVNIKGVINAGNLTVQALNSVDNTALSTASAYAAGTAASSVIEHTAADLGTYVKLSGAELTSVKDMTVLAKSDHKFSSTATAKSGSLFSLATMMADHDITDNAKVILDGTSLNSKDGQIDIMALAAVDDSVIAEGGSGGLYSDAEYVSEGKITQNAHVEFTRKGTAINAKGSVSVVSRTDTKGISDAVIDFSYSALDSLHVSAKEIMKIDSAVIMCDNTSVVSRTGDVRIIADAVRIYANADSRGTTSSLIHISLKPFAEMDITADARVVGENGANVNLAAIAGTLQIAALLPSGSSLHVRGEAFGQQNGATGNITSTCKNNVTAHTTVNFTGTGSVFQGINVFVTASSPLEMDTEYSQNATYKAFTVTGLVEKVVTKTVEVVDTVVEKVCEWLPWPLDHIVKWVTKTVVRVVEITEKVLVENVFQSETKSVLLGKYYSDITKNHVTLYGTIIYGSNTADEITVDKQGNISEAAPVKWHKDEENRTVYIDSYEGNLKGQLIITAQNGTIDGEVTVHIQNMVDRVLITNKSDYTLNIVDFDIYLNNSGAVKDYQLICSDHSNFKTNNSTSYTSASKLYIFNEQGTDLYFSGAFEAFLSDVFIEWINEAGNLYTTEDAMVRLGSLYITNVNEAGSTSEAAAFHLFASERTDRDGNAFIQQPEIMIYADKDVHLALTLNKYIKTTSENMEKVIEDNKDIKTGILNNIVSENGNVSLIFNPANLVIGLEDGNPASEGDSETQTMKETIFEDITVRFDVDKEYYDYMVYVIVDGDTLRYFKDYDCTEAYNDDYDGKVLYMLVDAAEIPGAGIFFYDKGLTQQVTGEVQLAGIYEADFYLRTGSEENGYAYKYYIMVEEGSAADLDPTITNKFKLVEAPYAGEEYFVVYVYDAESGEYRLLTGYEQIVFGVEEKDEYGNIITVKDFDTIKEFVIYDIVPVCYDRDGNICDFSGYDHYYINYIPETQSCKVMAYKYVDAPVGGSHRSEKVYGIGGTYSIEDITAGGDINITAAGRPEKKDESGNVISEAAETTVEIAGNIISVKPGAVYNLTAYNNSDVEFTKYDGKYETYIGSEGSIVTITADRITSINGFTGKEAPAFAEIRGEYINIVTLEGVGNKDNYISVDCSDEGSLYIDNKSGDVYITAMAPEAEGSNSLYIYQVSSQGTVNIAMQGRNLFAEGSDNIIVSSELVITDALNIGSAETPINNRFTGNGRLNLTAEESIYLNQQGDAFIGKLDAGNTVSLSAIPYGTGRGSIIDVSEEGSAAITAEHIILNAPGAGAYIGTEDRKLSLEFRGENNDLTAASSNDINIAIGSVTDSEGNAADLNVKEVNSQKGSFALDVNNADHKTVTLTDVNAAVAVKVNAAGNDAAIISAAAPSVTVIVTDGSIINGGENTETENITAAMVTLQAEKAGEDKGNVGAKGKPVVIRPVPVTGGDNRIGAAADGSVYLKVLMPENAGPDDVNRAAVLIEAGDEVILNTEGTAILTESSDIKAVNDITINAEKSLEIKTDRLTSEEGSVSITAGEDIKTGNITAAKGRVSFDAGNNITTGTVTGKNGADLTAGNNITTGAVTSEEGNVEMSAGNDITTGKITVE